MPRKRTIANEQGRKRQERYRAKLEASHTPEVAELDTALAVGLASLLLSPTAEVPRETILKVSLAAVDHLRSSGFNGKLSGPLIHRRLNALYQLLRNTRAGKNSPKNSL